MRHPARWTLGVSGVLGFWIGFVVFPTWHVAVESAQVTAGIVTYPAGNPFYLYHVRIWTVLHQILAVGLAAGFSERTLSEILSGVLGMVSLQALAMVVYALSRDAVYAIGAAFVVFFSQAATFGGVYPMWLMGTSNTYGVLGLSTLVLAVALVASERHRSGGVLLGIMPAIHPGLGLWLYVMLGLCIATSPRSMLGFFRPALRWMAAGAAVTAASLAIHLAMSARVPRIDSVEIARHFSAFITLWDGHRQPVPFNSAGIALNIAALGLALVWLVAFSDDVPRTARFLLRFTAVSAVVSLGGALLSWVPVDRLPASFIALMPGRVVNLDVMMCAALMFGLLGVYGNRIWSQAASSILAVALIVADRSQLWGTLQGVGWSVTPFDLSTRTLLTWSAIALVVIVAVQTRSSSAGLQAGRLKARLKAGTTYSQVLRIGRASALAAFAAWILPQMVNQTPNFRDLRYRDRDHDPVFAVAAAGDGLLATGGGLHLIQLRTRRPVLLDGGGLDGLAYAPESGPEMARIMGDVYGIDFFNPPPDKGSGALPDETNRRVWEGYSRERWREIRRNYGVTDVVTLVNWTLDLPLASESWDLRLYRIPE